MTHHDHNFVSLTDANREAIAEMLQKMPDLEALELISDMLLRWSGYSYGYDDAIDGIARIQDEIREEDGLIPDLRPITVWPVELTAPEFVEEPHQ